MDIIRGDGTLLETIDLAPANAYQEVLQNIAMIIGTWENTCPMLREFGMPPQLIGRPLPVVDPGCVTFEENAFTGKLIPIIKIEGVRDAD